MRATAGPSCLLAEGSAPAAGYPEVLGSRPDCRISDRPPVTMRTTCRLLGRTNDQALAAQSAAIVVPRWRIGLLIMPTVISIAPMWCFSDTGPRRLLANHNL